MSQRGRGLEKVRGADCPCNRSRIRFVAAACTRYVIPFKAKTEVTFDEYVGQSTDASTKRAQYTMEGNPRIRISVRGAQRNISERVPRFNLRRISAEGDGSPSGHPGAHPRARIEGGIRSPSFKREKQIPPRQRTRNADNSEKARASYLHTFGFRGAEDAPWP